MKKEFKELILSNADLIEIDESVAKKNGVEPLSKEILESLLDWRKIDPKLVYISHKLHGYPVSSIKINNILNGRVFEILSVIDSYALSCQTMGYHCVVDGELEIGKNLTCTDHYKEIWIRMILPPTQKFWNTQL